jgi:hypothetical protein
MRPSCRFRRRTQRPQLDPYQYQFLGTSCTPCRLCRRRNETGKDVAMNMGKGCILWLLGIPLPVIILLYIFFHK